MSKIVIIGTGNVGSHLTKAFKDKDVECDNLPARANRYYLDDADLVIVSVPDEFVSDVLEKVKYSILNRECESCRPYPVVAHTSGSIPMDTLQSILPEGTDYGVIYPLQTFSKGVPMTYSDIPCFIEGRNKMVVDLLKRYCSIIFDNVCEADSEIRGKYHIAAVFACNFTNHLMVLADNYLSDNNLEFGNLLPLIRQTIDKVSAHRPIDVQTGPAIRNDSNVIDLHKSRLKGYPELLNIYSLLTDSIIDLNISTST